MFFVSQWKQSEAVDELFLQKGVIFLLKQLSLRDFENTRIFRDAQKAKKNRSSYPGRSRIVKKKFPERGQDIIRTALIFQEKEPSKKCYAIFTRSDFPKFSRFSTISRENPREVTPKNSYFS